MEVVEAALTRRDFRMHGIPQGRKWRLISLITLMYHFVYMDMRGKEGGETEGGRSLNSGVYYYRTKALVEPIGVI